MSSITEAGHAGGFIVSEANGNRSREQVTILSGEVLEAGAVLGKITSGGKYVKYDNDGTDDGRRVAFAILYDAVDASDGDVEATIIARDAEVNGEELVWQSSDEVEAGIADLLAVGIIVRS